MCFSLNDVENERTVGLDKGPNLDSSKFYCKQCKDKFTTYSSGVPDKSAASVAAQYN